jgi:HAD superfamily hydrolase (TIGR01549 family)
LKPIIKLIVFDLDGVLINSEMNMKLSWDRIRKIYYIKKNFNTYKKYIGLPFYKILKKLKIKKKYFTLIKKDYDLNSLKYINKLKLYKNVRNYLKYLRKKKILTCIFTSKDKYRTKKILKYLNIKSNLTLSPEDLKFPKPNPYAINYISKRFNIKKNNILYIGDTKFDYICAKKAGVHYINASWGYGSVPKKVFQIKELSKISQYFAI